MSFCANRCVICSTNVLAEKVKRSGSADLALKFIKKLYGIDKRAKKQGLSERERYQLRQQEAQQILDKMHVWLVKKSRTVVLRSLFGIAVNYTLKQWHRLIGYSAADHATPENNLAEHAIRPFCVGRRNWLFNGTPEGAQARATLYSLIESAKANELESVAKVSQV